MDKRMPLDDIRAIVVATHQVSFTNECLARLLAREVVILHCDKSYKPVGWSVPLDRVIRNNVFRHQIDRNEAFTTALWKDVIHQKMQNQADLLDMMEVDHQLRRLIEKPLANEANVAKQFWGHYFTVLGNPQKREKKGAESFENKALNYGYAVVSTLVHRAILMRGLLPSLGIHHEHRYRSHPLVYDLMEPLRAFVEMFLAQFFQQFEEPTQINWEEDAIFNEWIVYLMKGFRECRIRDQQRKHTYKLMDAIEQYISSVASAFEALDTQKVWLPSIKQHYWQRGSESSELGDNEEQIQNGLDFSDV
jgi:CRISP-associated protein Cas1